MGLVELLLIAVGLSMDAFAVALSRGLAIRKLRAEDFLTVGVCFGGFQAGMPLLGWLLGRQFEAYITRVDHWIAFLLLSFIGARMIYEVWRSRHDPEEDCPPSNRLGQLLLLAVATSIDALAVGITFAFLQVSILPAVCLIGATTFLISCAGVIVGHKFGAKHQHRAELAGGAVLILIGTKILLEHLGFL
ncbi:putative manganese efflux pump MntP [bioreactor metagenome]|uniref:Putative manganese efflux pump MntP n=1 Tax=bioreactor metagenome TaxID=1076179 RepID=A0A644Z7W6_9ZZZZ